MKPLVIELPKHVYKHLVEQSEKQQKLPEQLAIEKLIAIFGTSVRSKNQAKQIAKDYLASSVGEALVPQTPSLDQKRSVWQVPVSIELLVDGWTEIGTLEIDANTGCVLTESPSFSTLFQRFRDLLEIEDFPAEKQACMSKLLDLGNQGKLTESMQAELEALLEESEIQQNANLQRLAQRLPARIPISISIFAQEKSKDAHLSAE